MNVKMLVGIFLVCVVAGIFFVAPIQAYFNRTANGDFVQTQDKEQLRTREHGTDHVMFQMQQKERLRTQNHECTYDCAQTQSRQRTEECFRNRTCTRTMKMEQLKN